ncbi:MAG: hypothetical protein M3Z26_16390 [Bacteroidota bacterium]|nr:hypothetical protein [Bacteroidota bacterium]
MLKKKIGIQCIFFVLGFPLISTAQNNSSPYSVLGIGDIENSYFNRYTGMGGASVALADARYINNSNAASLTAFLPRFYTFEISARYKQIFYSGGSVQAPNDKTSDLQMRRINLAAKITKHWGSSIGLMPFSTSSYSFSAYKTIQGTLQIIPTAYEGEGGINQLYWANGYSITKNTSIGITSSLLFGSLTQTESIQTGNAASTLITTSKNYLYNYYFNFSILTKKKLNNHWLSTYGLTFTPKTPLHSNYTVNVTDSSGAVVKNGIANDGYFTLPMGVNLGVALIKDGKYTFSVNAKSQYWNNLNYSGQNYQLVNNNRISIGFQNSNIQKNYYNQSYEKAFFQMGLYAGNSYLKVNNQQITDFGASIGYGRNSSRSGLGYIAALEVGRQGSTNTSVLSQNYVNLTFTFSFLDLLSSSKKY